MSHCSKVTRYFCVLICERFRISRDLLIYLQRSCRQHVRVSWEKQSRFCVNALIDVTQIRFRRFSPELGRPEGAERADSLRGFTRQDKQQIQRDRPSADANNRVSWRVLLQVRNSSSSLDRESDTTSYKLHHHYHHHHYDDRGNRARGQ